MSDIIASQPAEWETIQYRLPFHVIAGCVWATATQRQRSFARDARMALSGLWPPLELDGAEHIPVCGPALVACNHYSRPGFDAWWIALAISAAVAHNRAPGADPEIHWLMTAAWTYPESPWKHRFITPLTKRAFRRAAQVYGFVPMPAMPPDPQEVEERARAVLATLRLARQLVYTGGMIGLAPEGRDTSGGLGEPPEGAGRFIAHLVKAGLSVLPVGVSESHGHLRVSFGPVFVPQFPPGGREQDRAVARQVMRAIAARL
jgi:1-acyl-sn-glycerol-3-phosphate acyltransferase